MANTKNQRMWELLNQFRGELPQTQIIELISSYIASKLIQKNKTIQDFEQVYVILHKKYPQIANNNLSQYFRNKNSEKALLDELNKFNINNSFVEWFLTNSINKRYDFRFDFMPGSVAELSQIPKIETKGDIADLFASTGTFIKSVIKTNKFEGTVHLFSKQQLNLLLSFINIYPVNKKIELYLQDSAIQYPKNKFDFVYLMPPFGLKQPDPIKESIKNIDIILKEKSSVLLVSSVSLLFANTYKEEREKIVKEYDLNSIINLTNAFKPYTSITTSLIYFTKGMKKSNSDIFVSELNFMDETFSDIKEMMSMYSDFNKGKKVRTISPMTNTVSIKDLGDNFSVKRFDPKLKILESKLPKDNKIMLISELVDIIRSNSKYGTKDYSENKSNGKKPYLRIQNLKQENVVLKDVKFVTQKKPTEVTIKEKDILMSVSGTIGKLAKVTDENKNSLISSGIVILRPNPEKVDSTYLMNILKSKYVLAQIKNLTAVGVIPHLNKNEMEKIKIPVPSLAKQRTIAKKIDSLNSKLSDLRKKQKELEEELKKNIEEAFY